MAQADYILGIDYGAKRIGLALAHRIACLPRPFRTLENTPSAIAQIVQIVELEQVGLIIVGLPRSMDGGVHAQAERVEQFVAELKVVVPVPVDQIDETLTSVQAEEILAKSGQPAKDKGQIDAMAATLILERYFQEHATEHAG